MVPVANHIMLLNKIVIHTIMELSLKWFKGSIFVLILFLAYIIEFSLHLRGTSIIYMDEMSPSFCSNNQYK